jgi:RNA polymerase sigma factor (sigma-70 family)
MSFASKDIDMALSIAAATLDKSWRGRDTVIYFGRHPRPRERSGAARLTLPMTNPISGSTGNADAGASSDADRQRRERLNQMLVRVAKGDQQAFAELYRATSSRVFGVIVRMMHDRGEAEDILQEVYATAWRRADTFDPARGSAITGLITRGRNRTIDRMRQHREELLGDDDTPELADDAPTPAAAAEASEERRRLELCLERLEPQQGRAVRDAFFTGATYSELAQRLAVPLGTMKSWIRRSLMQLKTCLEQ